MLSTRHRESKKSFIFLVILCLLPFTEIWFTQANWVGVCDVTKFVTTG